jgi:hypothetical protein
MAKSKNVKLNVEPEGQEVDLSNVDLTPTGGSALDKLRANAEPKTAAPRTRSRRTTDAAAVAKSLDTPDLGEAYEKTSAMVARTEKPSRVGPERPLVNLNKKPIEGVESKLVERLDEEPTNVPRNFDKDGAFRNQIHGDYSHFAKVTNLIGFLGEKAGAAQEALGVDHPDTPKFDEIHKILSIAQGHLMDAQRAHQRGETGLVRVNPETGLAKPIGRQFLKDGREDPYGGQATERAIGYNPIAKINQAIGEPQLRSEGMTTQSLDSAPFGAVPHYHRAIQHIVTAANLLQGSLADVSSSQKLGSFDGAVKSWDGRYDERPGDPDTVTHAESLSDDYANSVAKSGSEIVKSNDDMTETGTSSVLELFNNTKKSYESEFNAKVQQAEIHAGLVAKNYREIFGGDIAARRAEAARKTEELKTLPVVPGPSASKDGMWGGRDTPLETRIAKEQNATDQEYAAERARVSLNTSSGAIAGLDNYLKIAKDAVAAGKLDASKLDELNGHAEEARGHHESALAKASSEIELPAEPTLTYDPAKDPRFRPDPIKYERMSVAEKAAERNKFLASRGQTLTAWQKESKAFEDKLPVIQARDASALADYKRDTAAAILGHHTAVAESAGKAIDSVSKMHGILMSAGVITPSEPAPVPTDITGIPTPEQYAKVSRPGRLATRAEALEFMKSENAKAAAESEAKAKAEAERKAALEASRPERGSAIEQAKELGFLTLDEETAQSFLDAGKGTVTPGMAAAGNPGAAGKRRADFLSGLAVQGSVEFSATPKPVAPGKAVFISPDTGIPATPASVNPKKTRRREAAVTRLNAAAAESGRRRLAGQVNTLGLNLEDVTVPEPKPERVRRTAAPVSQEEEDTKAILEGLQRSEATASGLAAARNSLQNIQEFNSENAATTVGTTIKPTRRTRK